MYGGMPAAAADLAAASIATGEMESLQREDDEEDLEELVES